VPIQAFTGSDGLRLDAHLSQTKAEWLAVNPASVYFRFDASSDNFSLPELNERLAGTLFTPNTHVLLDDDASLDISGVACPASSLLLVTSVPPQRKAVWASHGASCSSFATPSYREAPSRVSWSLDFFGQSADSEVRTAFASLATDDLPAMDSLIRVASILQLPNLTLGNLPSPLPPTSEFYPSLALRSLAANDIPSACRAALKAEPNSFCSYLARVFLAALVPTAPANLKHSVSLVAAAGLDPAMCWPAAARATASAQILGRAAAVSLVVDSARTAK